ncbi:hypothetical protein MSAN_02268600 [Mycena sanguinolenta]|uniref:DUF6534 domain-containing protein n=1 Tax=Mycena sanguinolenta TaxID=230812 RepID=A0A8H7CID3_9AGAR|nr:hypothetical protein MSAN_02268600 [Mycena sanguinolenta]
MSLPALDTITGVLLIGTWANSLLYMVEIIQANYYFRHFKNDDWKLKTFVAVAVLIDTVSTLGDYACVYLYTVTHAGDPVYLSDQHWPLSLHLFTTGVIAVLVQSFLVVRYWRFTRNNLVTLLNFFLIIVALGGSFTCAMVLAMFPAFKDRGKVRIPALIWLLWRARSTVVETRRVLDRLMALTVQSGAATAMVAVAALIAFLLDEKSNITVGIAYTLGRVYVVNMLENLNVRRSAQSSHSRFPHKLHISLQLQ